MSQAPGAMADLIQQLTTVNENAGPCAMSANGPAVTAVTPLYTITAPDRIDSAPTPVYSQNPPPDFGFGFRSYEALNSNCRTPRRVGKEMANVPRLNTGPRYEILGSQIARDFQDIRRRGNGNAGPTESGRQYDQSNPSEQLPDCSTLIPVQLADGKGEIIEDLVDGGACVS
ncbi:hypothetical protein OUZ56_010311 [Daphnia magna]|uniref:Uncharacterized protein n=1 Tax=Daphnia magna TaxID=35525 RepID=A0ABR0AI63_9CRUS|nr:hypothetical protein OUZ56_010311 [Daphnia magna]